jgi:hypothetical protein
MFTYKICSDSIIHSYLRMELCTVDDNLPKEGRREATATER